MKKITEIIIGTNNQGKYKEICDLMPDKIEKHSPKELNIPSPEELGKNFKENSSINQIRFVKGLEYFLDGHIHSQNQILKFINYCKSFEDDKGYLTQSFFKKMVSKKAKFISGPFTNMVFEIVEKQKKGLKILVGNIVTTISDKNKYLYRPV